MPVTDQETLWTCEPAGVTRVFLPQTVAQIQTGFGVCVWGMLFSEWDEARDWRLGNSEWKYALSLPAL